MYFILLTEWIFVWGFIYPTHDYLYIEVDECSVLRRKLHVVLVYDFYNNNICGWGWELRPETLIVIGI